MLTGATRQTRERNAPGPGWHRLALQVAGPGLLIASGAVHLDLYLTGYRTIPTIGPLFLFQVIAAFAIGLAAAVLAQRLVAAAAAGFSLATLGGYLLTVWIGMFGFKEVRTTSGIVAGLLEVAAFAALAALALTSAPDGPGLGTDRLREFIAAPRRTAGAAPAGLTVIALILLGVAVAGADGNAPAASSGGLRATSINGTSVLTNAKGMTLYWFAPDNSTMSKCYGSCAQYWPPVTGHPTAGTGVTGKIGSITRTDGTNQVTYDGRPLYTYVGDSAPGQAKGNNLNLNGGLWHEVTASGAAG